MGIFRSTNPTEFDDIDGIIINEQNPPPTISGVGANIAAIVGQFQRGPETLTEVGSIAELHEQFGKSSFTGNKALKNKKFGRLRVARVVAASGGAKASNTFDDDDAPTDIITFTAKHKGAYGNNITVTIENGTNSGKKYTISDTNTDAVLPDEVYDDVAVASITSQTFADSKLVDVTVVATSAEPANATATNLSSGSDGTVADTDYETAIALLEAEQACNVAFLDAYNTTRNGYLKTHVDAQKDKMAIVCGAESDSVATAATAADSLRSDRLIYGYPYVQTVIDGVAEYQAPASWIASIISQTSPHIDPAYVANRQFLSGIVGLKTTMTRANFITLNEAGISAFEFDNTLGYGLKNGVTTQIASVEKRPILRRRMADFLQDSVAFFLKQFQNAPNTKANRDQVKAAILGFDRGLERDGLVPTDDEVNTGNAKIVDTEALNSDLSLSQGFFKILYRRRIYSSMRYIVLQAEIGTSVVVTEGE